jgi:hypothetical protein
MELQYSIDSGFAAMLDCFDLRVARCGPRGSLRCSSALLSGLMSRTPHIAHPHLHIACKRELYRRTDGVSTSRPMTRTSGGFHSPIVSSSDIWHRPERGGALWYGSASYVPGVTRLHQDGAVFMAVVEDVLTVMVGNVRCWLDQRARSRRLPASKCGSQLHEIALTK